MSEEARFDLIDESISRLEASIREDILEIKNDVRLLRESYMEVSKALLKLSSIEEKYQLQTETCKDMRRIVENYGNRLVDLEKRMIPIEHFIEVKNKIITALTISGLSWLLGTLMILYKKG